MVVEPRKPYLILNPSTMESTAGSFGTRTTVTTASKTSWAVFAVMVLVVTLGLPCSLQDLVMFSAFTQLQIVLSKRILLEVSPCSGTSEASLTSMRFHTLTHKTGMFLFMKSLS